MRLKIRVNSGQRLVWVISMKATAIVSTSDSGLVTRSRRKIPKSFLLEMGARVHELEQGAGRQ